MLSRHFLAVRRMIIVAIGGHGSLANNVIYESEIRKMIVSLREGALITASVRSILQGNSGQITAIVRCLQVLEAASIYLCDGNTGAHRLSECFAYHKH